MSAIIKYTTHLTCLYIGLPVILLSILSCVPTQNQAPVINELIYPAEVPASFDTVLICRTADPGNDELRFQWSSENGTIRAEGGSITWTAPAVPATYKIGVRVSSASGKQISGQASMNVLPFYRTVIDRDPEINLRLPLFGSGAVSEQSLVRPLTTAEINCDAPLSDIKKYKYEWSCNGGKIQGTGISDGSAAKIGWVAPGVPGYYTVTARITDSWGNLYTGSVYFNVINPSCCGSDELCQSP